MSIYAIGDLHLSFGVDKPMNIFGDKWQNYEEKIKKNWTNQISENDTVILPGDFSWATYMEDTKKDFEFINKLPGNKILIKGNHDYWWSTIKKLNEFIENNNFTKINFIMNNAIECDEAVIVGTRGWAFSDTNNSDKMTRREAARLELSIKDALDKNTSKEIICVMHYPPITKNMVQNNEQSPYIEIMKKYGIKTCIYGHLHGMSHNEAVEESINGVNLRLVSSDYIQFKPYRLM